MAEISKQALEKVKEALKRYEYEVEASKLQENSRKTYLLHASHFVRRLEGKFTPGDSLTNYRVRKPQSL